METEVNFVINSFVSLPFAATDVEKYELQIGFVFPNSAQMLTSDALKYCWRYETDMVNLVSFFYKMQIIIDLERKQIFRIFFCKHFIDPSTKAETKTSC